MGIFYLLLEIVVEGTRDVCVYICVCVCAFILFFVFMVEWVEKILFIDCNFYF